jgi:hypothetical protein
MNKWTSDERAGFSAPCFLSTKSLTEVPPFEQFVVGGMNVIAYEAIDFSRWMHKLDSESRARLDHFLEWQLKRCPKAKVWAGTRLRVKLLPVH